MLKCLIQVKGTKQGRDQLSEQLRTPALCSQLATGFLDDSKGLLTLQRLLALSILV